MMQRREFVKTCTGAAVVVAAPGGWAQHEPFGNRVFEPTGTTTLRDAQVKALALRAVDAAQTAGARYADVRLTATTTRSFNSAGGPRQTVALGLSVRALVNGYWGWGATPSLSSTEAVRVGRLATELAKSSAERGRPRTVELGTVSPVRDGEWTTPVVIDPFDLEIEEIHDWIYGLATYVRDLGTSRGDPKTGWNIGIVPGGIGVAMYKQERLFASTEGSLLTQTVIFTEPHVGFTYRGVVADVPNFGFPVQAGWERVTETPIRERIRLVMDQIDERAHSPLPRKPVDIGRYDIVFSASAMAVLVKETLAPATELDRALGYEANEDGTSYLGPHPLALLGTTVASPLVTVTANRSTPTALATIKWDDEGIAPQDFSLIKDGVLMDYQTTREQGAWLAPWYEKQGQSVHSHGCAMAPDALSVTMQHTPNLIMQPGASDHDIDDLVAGLEHGLVVEGLRVDMDFQCNNGEGFLTGVTEVRRGKRVASIMGTGLLFRSTDFWKKVTTLGGPRSVEWIDGGSQKGSPKQNTPYSIATVPALVTQQAIIDPMRKA